MKLILNPFYKPVSCFYSISEPILGFQSEKWPDTLGEGVVYICFHTCASTVVQIYFAFISTPTCPRRPTLSGEEG